MEARTPTKQETPRLKRGITHIRVKGFKSIAQEQEIAIRPLTILAGANSSGKSSMMQPLLLLKQTLDVAYDPGALWLNGPNVKFTSKEQFLSHRANPDHSFSAGLTVIGDPRSSRRVSQAALDVLFLPQKHGGKLDVQQMVYQHNKQHMTLYAGMPAQEIESLIPAKKREQQELSIIRNRCFLDVGYTGTNMSVSHYLFGKFMSPVFRFGSFIQEIIHLPGLRGNPERTYPLTAVGSMLPGTFEAYAASFIAQWQEQQRSSNGQEQRSGSAKLQALNTYLGQLGLTSEVQAKLLDETQVELQVGRLPHAMPGGERSDFVNIADVGFGVSQTLPVLVALQEAKAGQLVYLEQPEIHLHPRAQTAMARILADAAIRGVRVVVETHSSLLVLGIQTLVAEHALPAELVKLHWFSRNEEGFTNIASADLDETGAFGDWPEDFAEVELDVILWLRQGAKDEDFRRLNYREA
jgi:predicted ATPase